MIGNQLKAGAVLNYAIIIINALVGILYTPYMLRHLGQSEYGLYSLVASVISYLTILDFGMGNAIVRYTAFYRAKGSREELYEMFGTFFILYLFVSILVLLGGFLLYLNVDSFFGNTMTQYELLNAKIMIAILIFNLAVSFPMSIFSSIITAYERFVFPKLLTIIRILLNTLVVVILLKYGYKAVSIVIVHTLFNLLSLYANYLYSKLVLKIKIVFKSFNVRFIKEVSVYSFWIFLNVIMDKIYWSTGQFVLGAVSGTIAVSIFAIAIQLHAMYNQFSTAIASVFLPRVTTLVSTERSDTFISDLFIKTGRIQFCIMSLILSGFICFGKPFILLWAGKEYGESYIISILFFISLFIPLIQNLGITILQARNQMKFRSVLYLIISVISLIFQIFLAKIWGPIGCGVSISVSLLLGQGLIMNYYYYKYQKINIILFWKEIARMSVVPITIVLVVYNCMNYYSITTWFDLILAIIIFGTLYVSCLYFFSMNSYEKNLISQPIRKIFN